MLSYTKETALATKSKKYLFYDTEINENDDWDSHDFNKLLQAKGDLGDRMRAAFETVLAENEKAVIIGSDCPELTTELVEEAFEKLELVDVVLGPTLDGGYYLLGMKKNHPILFEDIHWSTAEVYEQTRQKIIAEGLLFTVVQKLSDLDNIADLEKFPDFS